MIARTVWLASYPKSGNTWIRVLLTALEQGGALDINRIGHGPIASARWPLRRWLGMPSSDFTAAELARFRPLVDTELNAELEQVRFRKIHDALLVDGAPIVPPRATLGAVYIVRDPRSVAVSLAHHFGVDLEQSVRLMADPAGPFGNSARHNELQVPQRGGTWSEHVRGWLEHDLFPVLRVRYEDLHADPVGELRRITAFAGLEASDEAIALAVQAGSFERLSAQEAAAVFQERARADAPFFRRGQADAWGEELPEGLARQIEADHGETMKWLDYLPAAVPV